MRNDLITKVLKWSTHYSLYNRLDAHQTYLYQREMNGLVF